MNEDPEEYTESEFLGFRPDLPLIEYTEWGLWGDAVFG